LTHNERALQAAKQYPSVKLDIKNPLSMSNSKRPYLKTDELLLQKIEDEIQMRKGREQIGQISKV
jgi:hypothetical protein